MHNTLNLVSPSVYYAAMHSGIPVVQTVHDYQMICPNHLFYSFSENKPCERCLDGSKLNCIKHNCIHGSKVKSVLGVIESKLYSILNITNIFQNISITTNYFQQPYLN